MIGPSPLVGIDSRRFHILASHHPSQVKAFDIIDNVIYRTRKVGWFPSEEPISSPAFVVIQDSDRNTFPHHHSPTVPYPAVDALSATALPNQQRLIFASKQIEDGLYARFSKCSLATAKTDSGEQYDVVDDGTEMTMTEGRLRDYF